MAMTNDQTGQPAMTTTAPDGHQLASPVPLVTTVTVFACTDMHPTRAQIAAASGGGSGSGTLTTPAVTTRGMRVERAPAATRLATHPHSTLTMRQTYDTPCAFGKPMYVEWDITAAADVAAVFRDLDSNGAVYTTNGPFASYGPGLHVFGATANPPAGLKTYQTEFFDSANSYIYDYYYCP